MIKKYDGTHFLLMYLTGYAFFSYQIYSQILFSYHGVDLIIPLSIAFLLMPLIIFYVIRKINNKARFNHTMHFIFNILNIVYLSIISLLILNYASVMVHNYYYQSVKSYIIAFFFLIPIFYILFKNSRVYYSLAFVIFFIYLLFKFLYLVNHEVIDFYPLYNALSIDSPFIISLFSLTLIFEPILLLANTTFIDHDKKINTKLIVIVAIIISILGIYTIIREAMEFGLLLETVSFPYFESCKYMSIETNFDNIDYYYLFSVTVALFSRLPMFYFNIKDNFKLKSKGIVIIFIVTLIAFYYLQMRLEFYLELISPILIITSLLLLLLFILSFFCKRRLKDDS